MTSCQWLCVQDSTCTALWYSAPAGSDLAGACCLLRPPLVLITGTAVVGASYLKRNGSAPPAPRPFACAAGSVTVYPRQVLPLPHRSSGGSSSGSVHGGSKVLAVHLVDYNLASTEPPTPAAGIVAGTPATTLAIMNNAMHGGSATACEPVAMQLLTPNAPATALAPLCKGNRTVVELPMPAPWSIVLVTVSNPTL